jgi:hypothetical protein
MEKVTVSKKAPLKVLMFFTSIILGIAWAARGSFGHEQGAFWAGAVGTLALVAVTNRKDWLQKAPVLVALGGLGWAVGGMMSYGVVLSYAKGNDFVNVFYGLSSIALLGALYGFLGGGFFALGLESNENNKPKWAALISEMFVGGFLFWGLFIYQLEWLMTPPRSELWAAVLGAAIAMAWHFYRHKFYKALRVAAFTAIGAGFGFSFGNFILVAGGASGLSYNFWNIMEFLIGFCGGLGMTYAVVTQEWPRSAKVSQKSNWFALVIVVLVIPLINFAETFTDKKLGKIAAIAGIENAEGFITANQIVGLVIIAVTTLAAIYFWNKYKRNREKLGSSVIPWFTFGLSGFYIVFVIIVNGLYFRGFPIGDSVTLYFPLLFIACLLRFVIRNKKVVFGTKKGNKLSLNNFLLSVAVILIILAIIALVIINTVGVDTATKRFV